MVERVYEDKGCICSVISVGDENYLSIMAYGGYYRFGPLNQGNLLRLVVEASERALVATQGAYATRIGAAPLEPCA